MFDFWNRVNRVICELVFGLLILEGIEHLVFGFEIRFEWRLFILMIESYWILLESIF